MPKFKMVLHQREQKNPDGSVAVAGVSVAVPVDEAAKADKLTETAVQLGLYTPKDPNERETIAQKLKERANVDARRRGGI